MKILGISFLADASAVILINGKLVSAVSEERLNRVKLWHGIPEGAIAKALEIAGIQFSEIDLIATHGLAPDLPPREPFKQKEEAIRQASISDEIKKRQLEILHSRYEHECKVFGERTPEYLNKLRALGKPMRIYGHHQSHAASAYFGSSWDSCLVFTCDGWGEDGSASLWTAQEGRLLPVSTTPTIDSLGYFYGSITEALGFVPERHEGKVLGLAAYVAEPKSYDVIRSMIDYDSVSKRFLGRMDRGLYMPNFNNPGLQEIVKAHSREDIASATQRSLEEVVCQCIYDMGDKAKRLAVAGGVMANVKLNQRLKDMPNVEEIFVCPNMGDGGLGLGAAWLAHQEETGARPEPLKTLYLGPEYSNELVEDALRKSGLIYVRHSNIHKKIGQLLADGHVVARFSGRMEFGPRSLGARSILFKATDASVNQWLNVQLHRSEFMPFAPVTLAEFADEYYTNIKAGREPARFMAMTFDCTEKMKKEAPAAVHIDATARPQLVTKQEHPDLYNILTEYYRLTGHKNLINTSFNMHEEPIVCSPDDAIRAFCDGHLPYLAIEDFLLENQKK